MSWSMGSMDMIPGAVAGRVFRVKVNLQSDTFAAGMGLAACVRSKSPIEGGGSNKATP